MEGAPIEVGDGLGTTVTLVVDVPRAGGSGRRRGRSVTERPTVLLVDDRAVVRAGIRMLLEAQADVTVVAEASSAEDAIAVVLDRDPDVIVTDLSMEGIRGASVVEAFVDSVPERTDPRAVHGGQPGGSPASARGGGEGLHAQGSRFS